MRTRSPTVQIRSGQLNRRPNGILLRSSATPFTAGIRRVLGQNVYSPIVDATDRLTRIGNLEITHASGRRLPPLARMEEMVITDAILARLQEIHDCRMNGRNILVEGEPGSVKTLSFRLYSHLAGLDFYRLNGFPEADETDFMGGDRPIAPGVIKPVKGFLPTVAEHPGLGLLDEISRFKPEILPSVLNAVLDTGVVRRQVGAEEFQEIPVHAESYLAGTLNSRHHLGSNPLPPDTRDRFLLLRWGLLPEADEKVIAASRFDLPENVVTSCWNFFEAITRATGPGTQLEVPIRPFARRDFHRLAKFTRLFCGGHGGDFMKSAYANACDLFLARIPAAKDRKRLQDAFMDAAFGRDNRPTEWPPRGLKTEIQDGHLTIGDANLPVRSEAFLDDIEETPFTLNLMRLTMKAIVAETHLFIRGPSGIGKSAILRHALYRRLGGFVERHFTRGMSSDELMGRYYGTDQVGELQFGDTELKQALRGGLPFFADEVDNAKSEAVQLLLSVLDEGRLVLSQSPHEGVPTILGEKGFVFVGTLNPAQEYKGIRYVGKSPVVGTICDRGWEIFTDYEDEEMEKDELQRILARKFSGIAGSEVVVGKMVKCFQTLARKIAVKEIDNTELDREMPTKRWLIDWAKAAIKRWKADSSQSIETWVYLVAQREIAGRFRDGDRRKVTTLLSQHFSQPAQVVSPASASTYTPPWRRTPAAGSV